MTQRISMSKGVGVAESGYRITLAHLNNIIGSEKRAISLKMAFPDPRCSPFDLAVSSSATRSNMASVACSDNIYRALGWSVLRTGCISRIISADEGIRKHKDSASSCQTRSASCNTARGAADLFVCYNLRCGGGTQRAAVFERGRPT